MGTGKGVLVVGKGGGGERRVEKRRVEVEREG